MNAIPISMNNPAEAFRHAVDVLGGQVKAAEFMGYTQGAISKRLARGGWIWAENVLAVEAATGVSRYDLRPDIYPRENTQSPLSTRGDMPAGAGAPNARPAGTPDPADASVPSGREGSAPAAGAPAVAGATTEHGARS